MNVSIGATVQPGARVANKNVAFQLPHLILQFPELKNIHTATINLHLDQPLLISKFEQPAFIEWWDAGPNYWHPERFSILPIKFEYVSIKEAWLFVSYDSGYFQKAKMDSGGFRFADIEVVTEKIDGLTYGERCQIHVEKTDDIDVG
jgi:hypothetical protein